MEARAIRAGFRHAIRSSRCRHQQIQIIQPRRFYATPSDSADPAASLEFPNASITAAPPFQFGEDGNGIVSGNARTPDGAGKPVKWTELSTRLRIVPVSPSYFTGKPGFTDDFLSLQALVRKYQTLPVHEPGSAPRIAWKTLAQYKGTSEEPIQATRYNKLIQLLSRLNYIHTSLVPDEVRTALTKYMRDVQPFENKAKPSYVNQYGVARASGRRKTSTAVAHLVEGEGEVLINGKSLTEAFGRLHDRESAIWALKATDRIDKYNVFGVVKGGGTTGQAEALTLAVAKALLVHEPDLKPALRRAGCVTRDPRAVERKKAGKLKARKMPAWVKR